MGSQSLLEGEASGLSVSDSNIIMQGISEGEPCVLFIPVNDLIRSLSVLKPGGAEGYFIARIPALYTDGTIKYLYKDQFMLLQAVQSLTKEPKGKTYFFLGLDLPMAIPQKLKGLEISPEMFYTTQHSLFDVEFLDDVKFSQSAPSLDLAFLPADQSLRLGHINVVNFILSSELHPLGERNDPSGSISSYEDWVRLQYPTSGPDLDYLFDRHISQLSMLSEREYMKAKGRRLGLRNG